jgi:predicted dehydrogenase
MVNALCVLYSEERRVVLPNAIAESTGVLSEMGSFMPTTRWAFVAEPVRAWAAARYLHGVDVEMNGLVWLADGRVGAFDCGFTMPPRGWMEIAGSEGIVYVPDLWVPGPRATFLVRREGPPEEEIAVEGEDQIVRMIDHFSRASLFGEPLRPAPDEAVRTLRVLDALARSAREGREATV